MFIERFEQAPIAELARMYCGVYNDEFWGANWSLDAAQARLMSLRGKGHTGYVACMDGPQVNLNTKAPWQTIGMVVGVQEYWHFGAFFIIKDFCVAKQWQRMGVGKKLMEALLNTLKNTNVNKVCVMTRGGSDCIDFYKKHGLHTINSMHFMGCDL